MDNIIKGLWGQIVGDTNNQPNPSNASPEEEEKKAPNVYEEETKPKSSLKAYETKQIIPPKFPETTVEQIAEKIGLGFDEDQLDITTITSIMKLSLEIARKSYVELIFENRKERRKIFFENKKTYTENVIKLLRETENIMEKATDDLLEALNLPKELFENSIMFLMEKGYDQQLMITQANIIQTLREFLGSTKSMKIEDVKEIFKYQLKLLTDKQEEFTELIEFLKGDMETMHLIPLGINVIITDLIYDKFEIEEEDTMAVMKNPALFLNDMELGGLMMACEDAIHNIISKINGINGMF